MDRPAVLIVDDMEVNRDILSFYFRKEYTVLEAADGEEAIDTIKKYTDRIALVFFGFLYAGEKWTRCSFVLCKRTIIIYQHYGYR